MQFKLNILVAKRIPLVFEWHQEELKDIEAVENRFIAEMEAINPGLFDEWEVLPDKAAPFWAKSPLDILHKEEGDWGGDWSSREIFHDHLASDRMMIHRWLQASQVILISNEKGFNPDQIAVVLHFAFKGESKKDPVAFAQKVDFDALVKEFWKWFDD